MKCKVCGYSVDEGKYCPRCGAPLSNDNDANDILNNQKMKDFYLASKPIEVDEEPFDESNLKLICDCCKKTIAAVGGDGYSEIVLYQNGNDYEVHTFSKYAYMNKEEHHGYKADAKIYEEVRRIIDEEDLISWMKHSSPGLCGGDYIIKFLGKDNKSYRVTASNMPSNGMEVYATLNNLLYSYVNEENKF